MEDSPPIGAVLRRARVNQGLAIASCAEATCIRERYLVAIEEGRFDALPDPAYVNGFVRAYARHLGVEVEGPVGVLPVSEPDPPRPRQVHVPATRSHARPPASPSALRRRSLTVVLLLAAVAVVVALLAVGVVPLP